MYVAGTHNPVPVENFADHVRRLHANDGYLFTEEYSVSRTNGRLCIIPQ